MAKKSTVKKAASKKPAAATSKKAPAVKTTGTSKSRPAPAKSILKSAAPKATSKPKSAPTKPAVKSAPKTAPAPAPKPKAIAEELARLPAPAIILAETPVIDYGEYLPPTTPPPLVPKPGAAPLGKIPASPLCLSISAQASAGSAANGNTHPANILVIVTCGGSPVTELSKDHFTLMEHFDVPGQLAPFSNNITSFRNAGTGAYLLQTKPITGVPWRTGHHLAQLLISSPDDHQGQVAIKLVIR